MATKKKTKISKARRAAVLKQRPAPKLHRVAAPLAPLKLQTLVPPEKLRAAALAHLVERGHKPEVAREYLLAVGAARYLTLQRFTLRAQAERAGKKAVKREALPGQLKLGAVV